MAKKYNLQLAWEVYNYLTQNDQYIFGNKTLNNTAYIFILTLTAMYGSVSFIDLINVSGVSFKELYMYLDSLTLHFELLKRETLADGVQKYMLSESFIKTVQTKKLKLDYTINVDELNKKVFLNVLKNMRYHMKILSKNLCIEEHQGKFKLMRALLNPVISNPVRINDVRQLSRLGYMKLNPKTKELKLNKHAYLKDWTGSSVI